MLSKQTQSQFAEYLFKVSEWELRMERIREELCSNLYFEPYTVFTRLDYKRIGYINVDDICQFFKDNSVEYSQHDIIHLVRRIDSDKDQYISFSDFCRYIMPQQDQKLSLLAGMREPYQLHPKLTLPIEVEFNLCRLLTNENNKIRQLHSTLFDLTSQDDWDSPVAFELVNKGKNWDSVSLMIFISQYSQIQLNTAELLLYRIDRNKDYRIDYSDFVYLTTIPEDLIQKPQQSDTKVASQQSPTKTPERKTKLIANQSSNYKSSNSTAIKSPQQPEQVGGTLILDVLQYLIDNQGTPQQQQMKQLEQSFMQIDKHNNGYLTLEDFSDYLKQHNRKYSIQQVLQLLKSFDQNRDGRVDFDEFSRVIRQVIENTK